jgi:hypothetical protein
MQFRYCPIQGSDMVHAHCHEWVHLFDSSIALLCGCSTASVALISQWIMAVLTICWKSLPIIANVCISIEYFSKNIFHDVAQDFRRMVAYSYISCRVYGKIGIFAAERATYKPEMLILAHVHNTWFYYNRYRYRQPIGFGECIQ